MKFIKKWYLFREEVEDDLGADKIKSIDTSDVLQNADKTEKKVDDSVMKNVAEYKAMRLRLEDVFKKLENDEKEYTETNGASGKIWDDAYLEDQLTKNVYRNKRETISFTKNPFLKNYESVFKLKRIFDRVERSLQKDRDSLDKLKTKNTELNDRLVNTTNPSLKKSIQDQISDNTKKMTELNQNISSNLRERTYAKERYDIKLSNFKKLMIEEEKKARNA